MLLSLQILYTLFFPHTANDRALLIDASALLFSEFILIHAGVMSAGLAGSRSAGFVLIVPMGAVYFFLLWGFSHFLHSRWLVANIGVLLAVRLASAPFAGARGAAERIINGFMGVALFALFVVPPIMSINAFPVFGITPEVHADLKLEFPDWKSTSTNSNAGNLSRWAVLAALAYLLGAVAGLRHLGRVSRDTSAPALDFDAAGLIIRASGKELVLTRSLIAWKRVVRVQRGEIEVRESGLGAKPTIRCATADDEYAILLQVSTKQDKYGKSKLLNLMLRIGRDEIPVIEDMVIGHPSPVTLGIGGDGNRVIGNIVVRGVGEIEASDDEAESESQARGLRELMLAYVEGIDEPGRRTALLANPDVRGLLGREAGALLEATVSAGDWPL